MNFSLYQTMIQCTIFDVITLFHRKFYTSNKIHCSVSVYSAAFGWWHFRSKFCILERVWKTAHVGKISKGVLIVAVHVSLYLRVFLCPSSTERSQGGDILNKFLYQVVLLDLRRNNHLQVGFLSLYMGSEQLKVNLGHFHDDLLTLIYLRNRGHTIRIEGMRRRNQLKYLLVHPKMDP